MLSFYDFSNFRNLENGKLIFSPDRSEILVCQGSANKIATDSGTMCLEKHNVSAPKKT